MICALKINLVFFLIFTGAGTGFALLAGAFWRLAEGQLESGANVLVVSDDVVTTLRIAEI